MKSGRANKGQFSIIAALLVSVILVTAIISTYSMVRHAPIQDSPKVLTAMGEMNSDIKRILDHTIGYYGSILKVTGNTTYAQNLTTSYLSSGLVHIAHSHPEWNPSFSINFEQVSTSWFMPESYSMGNISLTYSLSSLGIEGVTYETSSALTVKMLSSNSGVAQIKVIRDKTEAELGLSKENFWFYKYNYDDSTWELVNPTNLIISSSGIYSLTIPAGVDHDSFSVQVGDNRGITVTAFYSENSVILGIPHYTYNFNWNVNGMQSIYNSLSTDTMIIEFLQNGTLKWLDQNLVISPQTKPIPPIPIKALRVNATINGVNQEVSFQVENWASSYRIPLGLAGNQSIFNNNNMVAFLVDDKISDVRLWWDGHDTARQTSYAWENIYFNDNSTAGILDNGFLKLNIHNFYIESRVIGESTSYRADFLRINDETPTYGAKPAFIIYNGVVRDIIQQEPEYSSGVAGCPNIYSQVFLTIPANTPYYTYTARTIFLNSSMSRNISDLSVIQLSGLNGESLTENGKSGSYPATSSSTGLFYDSSPTSWDHHWSQRAEVPSSVSLINAQSFEGTWLPAGWTRTGNWNKENNRAYQGSYSADFDGESTGVSGNLVTSAFDCSDAVSISVSFRFYDENLDGNEFLLEYFDGSSWVGIADLGNSSESTWNLYQQEITDPRYFVSGFKIRWVANNIRAGTGVNDEHAYVDLVNISKKIGNSGAGIMFTDNDNNNLYIFDPIVGSKTGALNVLSSRIEVNPVERYAVNNFTNSLDLIWVGAVVTFDNEPIYRSSGNVGLWVMVEYPPHLTVD